MAKVENVNVETLLAWGFMKDVSSSKEVSLQTWLRTERESAAEGRCRVLLICIILWRGGNWDRNRSLTCKFQIQT